jgi:hypothetical protein
VPVGIQADTQDHRFVPHLFLFGIRHITTLRVR